MNFSELMISPFSPLDEARPPRAGTARLSCRQAPSLHGMPKLWQCRIRTLLTPQPFHADFHPIFLYFLDASVQSEVFVTGGMPSQAWPGRFTDVFLSKWTSAMPDRYPHRDFVFSSLTVPTPYVFIPEAELLESYSKAIHSHRNA